MKITLKAVVLLALLAGLAAMGCLSTGDGTNSSTSGGVNTDTGDLDESAATGTATTDGDRDQEEQCYEISVAPPPECMRIQCTDKPWPDCSTCTAVPDESKQGDQCSCSGDGDGCVCDQGECVPISDEECGGDCGCGDCGFEEPSGEADEDDQDCPFWEVPPPCTYYDCAHNPLTGCDTCALMPDFGAQDDPCECPDSGGSGCVCDGGECVPPADGDEDDADQECPMWEGPQPPACMRWDCVLNPWPYCWDCRIVPDESQEGQYCDCFSPPGNCSCTEGQCLPPADGDADAD